MTALNSSYYAATAYRSDRIPKQEPSAERSWIRRFAKMRLPWGITQEIAPDDFLREAAPMNLRHVEEGRQEKAEQSALGTYIPAPYEHVDFYDREDHELFRFSLWSTRSRFWIYLTGVGKGLFYIAFVTSIMTYLLML